MEKVLIRLRVLTTKLLIKSQKSSDNEFNLQLIWKFSYFVEIYLQSSVQIF